MQELKWRLKITDICCLRLRMEVVYCWFMRTFCVGNLYHGCFHCAKWLCWNKVTWKGKIIIPSISLIYIFKRICIHIGWHTYLNLFIWLQLTHICYSSNWLENGNFIHISNISRNILQLLHLPDYTEMFIVLCMGTFTLTFFHSFFAICSGTKWRDIHLKWL